MSQSEIFEGLHKGTNYRIVPLNEDTCTLYRNSPFGGSHNIDVHVSAKTIKDYYDGKLGMVQQAFPQLTADMREFIMTGITPEQWAKL